MSLIRSPIVFEELLEFVKTKVPPPGWIFAPGNDKLDICYASPNDECLIWDSVERCEAGRKDFELLVAEFIASTSALNMPLPTPIRERASVRRHRINGAQVRFAASTYKLVGGTAIFERRNVGDEVWYTRIIICTIEEGERHPALVDSYGQWVREEEEAKVPDRSSELVGV